MIPIAYFIVIGDIKMFFCVSSFVVLSSKFSIIVRSVDGGGEKLSSLLYEFYKRDTFLTSTSQL